MARYALGLSEFEKRVVAVYVGGRPLGARGMGAPPLRGGSQKLKVRRQK
jgi:hypothetical protein